MKIILRLDGAKYWTVINTVKPTALEFFDEKSVARVETGSTLYYKLTDKLKRDAVSVAQLAVVTAGNKTRKSTQCNTHAQSPTST